LNKKQELIRIENQIEELNEEEKDKSNIFSEAEEANVSIHRI
jgi:hypothetical protein